MTRLKITVDNGQLQTSSTGTIKYNKNHLRLECSTPINGHDYFAAVSQHVAGQIIPPHLLIAIEAQTKVSEFTAETISFDFSGQVSPVSECKFSAKVKHKRRIIFGIFSEKSKRIPPLSMHRKIAGGEYWLDFSNTAVPEGVFYAELDDTFAGTPSDLAESVLFSLRFLSGSPLNFRVLSIAENGQENVWLYTPRSIEETEFLAPINLRQIVYPAVENYIDHFLQYSLSTGYSATNYLLDLCWQISSSAQISSRVLAVTVAIEGLAQKIVGDDKRPPDQDLDDLLAKFENVGAEWVEKSTPELKKQREHAQDRAKKLLARSSEYTGQSLVEYAFKKIGYPITAKEKKLWSRGRNATAHGGFNFSNASKEQKERLEQYFTCTYLLYRLIFANSNYKGYFTNYSKPDWPTEMFP